MSVTIQQARQYIMEKYSGWTWKKRVMAMSDQQVWAIYLNMKKKGA